MLAQLLAALGQPRVANNLNQLAYAANTGSLALTPDEAAGLRHLVTRSQRCAAT